jgi:hypothetical protein
MSTTVTRPRPSVVLPKSIRSPNTIVWTGTSRIISQFLDPQFNNQSNSAWINWASGWLRAQNKPLLTVANLATSGFRTDQFAPAVASAVALAPALMGLDGPVNDIAQLFPTSGTCAATAFANLKTYIKKANDAGIPVVYVWERGTSTFTATMIAIHNDFSRMMADYLQWGDDFRGPPNVIMLDPTAKTVTVSNAAAIVVPNSQDGTHDNIVGGQLLGLYFANKLAPYLRELPGHRLRTLTQNSNFGVRNVWASPGMTGSVAATGTGNTGTVPTNASTQQTGGVSAVFSTQASVADADGNTWGNDVKIVATATAAGSVSIIFTLTHTNIVVGDIIRGGIEIDVASGATSLTAAACDLEVFPTTGGAGPTWDMQVSGLGTDHGGYAGFPMEPPALRLAAFTGTAFTNLCVRMFFNGAGSATVLLRKGWAERATA